MQNIYELTEKERFEFLQALALRLIRAKPISTDEQEWLGRGLMNMCAGQSLHDAFQVSKPKPKNICQDAYRSHLVDRLHEGKPVDVKIIKALREFLEQELKDVSSNVIYSDEQESIIGIAGGEEIIRRHASAKNVPLQFAVEAVAKGLNISGEALKSSRKNAKKSARVIEKKLKGENST